MSAPLVLPFAGTSRSAGSPTVGRKQDAAIGDIPRFHPGVTLVASAALARPFVFASRSDRSGSTPRSCPHPMHCETSEPIIEFFHDQLGVARLDPDAAARKKERARREAYVRAWQEDSGNMGLSARQVPSADGVIAWQNIERRALDLRAAGIEGTAGQLQVRAMMDYLLGRAAPGACENAHPGAGQGACHSAHVDAREGACQDAQSGEDQDEGGWQDAYCDEDESAWQDAHKRNGRGGGRG